MVSEAIAQGDVQALNYFVAQKYTAALAEMASAKNHKIIMMPLEATSLIGSLGGIGAIAKEVFGNNSGAGGEQNSQTPAPRKASTKAAPARNDAATRSSSAGYVSVPNHIIGNSVPPAGSR